MGCVLAYLASYCMVLAFLNICVLLLYSPHPGNIFILDDGSIGLIDFGQVKQISGRNRETLCKVMIALDERNDNGMSQEESNQLVAQLAEELGVKLQPEAPAIAGAAVGIWLFDGSATELPGGYDLGELSPNSPVRELKSFPQDLVLVGRSSILIKGLSSRLGIPWSLAQEWAPIAREVLADSSPAKVDNADDDSGRVRFRQVYQSFRQWGKGRVTRFIRRLPTPIQNRVAQMILKAEERKTRKKLMKREIEES